jgi:hypothetical protein
MKKLILGMVFVFATGTIMNASANVKQTVANEIEVAGDCMDNVYEIISQPKYDDISVEAIQWLMYWMCEA